VKVCRTSAALGAQRLILSGEPASTDDDLARKVESLHNAWAVAKRFGRKLAYHIHDKEFTSSAREFKGCCALPIRA
jgi:hypothetical protein